MNRSGGVGYRSSLMEVSDGAWLAHHSKEGVMARFISEAGAETHRSHHAVTSAAHPAPR